MMCGVMGRKDLSKLEAETARDFKASRKAKPRGARKRNDYRTRLPVPVPKNKSLEEIKEMDPDDPQFKHVGGPRKAKLHTDDTKGLSLVELQRREKQQSVVKQRAKIRKAEAVSAKAMEVTRKKRKKDEEGNIIEDEEMLIAEGVLDLEDWDNEELVRGYRRQRNGRFGTPPKYIPREVQQEALRRLYKRGERKMQEAYMDIINKQIGLATGAESEKVMLEAQKAIQERLIGKVPDTIRVGVEAPWQDMLADSLIPVGEALTVDLSETYEDKEGATIHALPPPVEEE